MSTLTLRTHGPYVGFVKRLAVLLSLAAYIVPFAASAWSRASQHGDGSNDVSGMLGLIDFARALALSALLSGVATAVTVASVWDQHAGVVGSLRGSWLRLTFAVVPVLLVLMLAGLLAIFA